MGQESVLPEMILPVVEVIFALLGFVREVELGELSKGAEAEHSKCTGQASHSATATFYCTLKQLAMYIFHVLEHSDKLVFGRRTCDDPCLRQHISTTSRLQLHLIHEVLYAVPIENAVAVNEKHE
jgi:hypothetical protein